MGIFYCVMSCPLFLQFRNGPFTEYHEKTDDTRGGGTGAMPPRCLATEGGRGGQQMGRRVREKGREKKEKDKKRKKEKDKKERKEKKRKSGKEKKERRGEGRDGCGRQEGLII